MNINFVDVMRCNIFSISLKLSPYLDSPIPGSTLARASFINHRVIKVIMQAVSMQSCEVVTLQGQI